MTHDVETFVTERTKGTTLERARQLIDGYGGALSPAELASVFEVRAISEGDDEARAVLQQAAHLLRPPAQPVSAATATHTVVALEVSPGVYDEIGGTLRAAGWDHAFHSGGIDVTGLLLVRKQTADPTKFCPGCGEPTARELTAHGDRERRFFCVAHCGQETWTVPFPEREDT